MRDVTEQKEERRFHVLGAGRRKGHIGGRRR